MNNEKLEQFLYGTGNEIQVILKITERCNLACTYCYFFYGGDESYLKHSGTISKENADSFADFLFGAVSKYNIDKVRVILHGGEPLLLKKHKFRSLCESFEKIKSHARLELTIQTNGVLIDNEWIDIFSQYDIYVGISLDGPPKYNDLYRVDKKGRGSYFRTLKGINQLFAAEKKGLIVKPGLLCVLNTDFSSTRLYNHFIKELGFKNVDFLLPDENHETFNSQKENRYVKSVKELFDLYKVETDKDVSIRLFNKILSSLTAPAFYNKKLREYYTRKDIVFTVSSDGDISPDDILRTSNPDLMNTALNIKNNDIKDIINDDIMQKLLKSEFSIPQKCKGCDWANACKGGELYHRYSSKNGFENKSVYCKTLKMLYAENAKILMNTGVSVDELKERLY